MKYLLSLQKENKMFFTASFGLSGGAELARHAVGLRVVYLTLAYPMLSKLSLRISVLIYYNLHNLEDNQNKTKNPLPTTSNWKHAALHGTTSKFDKGDDHWDLLQFPK